MSRRSGPDRRTRGRFGAALGAADPGEAVFQQATVEVLAHHLMDHRAERAVGGLEEYLVSPGEAIEVIHDQAVEGSALGAAGPVGGRSLPHSLRLVADSGHDMKGDARERCRARRTAHPD